MAEFSGKIVDAYYTNEEYSIIKILYDDNGALSVYHLENNPEDSTFKEFEAEGWDHDKLVDSTAEFKKAQATAFNIEVNNAARVLIEESMSREVKALEQLEDYFELFVNDTDKDNLFKFKLWALETPLMKVATKDQKSSLRKAKSLLEGFSILHEIKQQEK